MATTRAGLGMNSGIHDGMELTEILTSVMRDGYDETLLERYQRRRRAGFTVISTR